jgi:signal peptidase I
MNLDSPWKIGALVGALVVARLLWWLWKEAPSRKTVLEFLDSGLIAFTLVFLIVRPFVVQAFFIPSESMVPTLLKHDRILVNRFIYRLNAPKRGDIIVFDAPAYALQPGVTQADFVKRLIGLPGDRVHVEAGEGVFINGEKLQEAPGTDTPRYNWPEDEYHRWTGGDYVVPKGNYLVLGDNRNTSYDSHLWQLPSTGEFHPELASSRVLGKAMVIFWPPGRIGLLSDNAQAHVPSDGKASGAAQAAR